MKLKKAIEILDDHNKWRRGDTNYTHTNPKELWIAIDKIVEEYKDYEEYEEDIEIEEMLASSIWELQFANLQRDYLLSVLQELEVMTNDKLSKSIIENAIERYNMDKLIHVRTIFDNK